MLLTGGNVFVFVFEILYEHFCNNNKKMFLEMNNLIKKWHAKDHRFNIIIIFARKHAIYMHFNTTFVENGIVI